MNLSYFSSQGKNLSLCRSGFFVLVPDMLVRKENYFKTQLKKILMIFFGTRMRALQSIVSNTPVPVLPDNLLVQSINTNPFSIEKLSVRFATYQRANDCQIELWLYSKTGKLLHHELVSARAIVDNEYYSLVLQKEFAYKGELHLCITSPDATPCNCVAVWTMPEPGAVLRRIPIQGRAIPVVLQDNRRELAFSGISMMLQQGRYEALLHRNYLREKFPLKNSIDLPDISKNIALIGFDNLQLDALSRLNRHPQLKFQPVPIGRLDQLSPTQAILFPAALEGSQAKSIARIARREGLPLIAVSLGDQALPPKILDLLPAYADGLISQCLYSSSRLPQSKLANCLRVSAEEILVAYQNRMYPVVSIVSILSGKIDQLPWVIESYFNQTYRGEIEIVFVNGGSDDAESTLAEVFSIHAAVPHAHRLTYRILRNELDLGNCESRNRGVAASNGQIIVLVDADCMLSQQFIQAHVDAHSYLDCEVVIGPHNIKTNGSEPRERLAELEKSHSHVLDQSELRDRVFLDGFLNCITRNFSIKKTAIIEELFDRNFSYSLASESGFGWEDVEMGYRLYKRGLGIKFTEDAFSVHISHPSAVAESEKPKKSIRNFCKLFQKHPELRDVGRRWAVQTLDSLNDWSANIDPEHHKNSDLIELNQLFSGAPRPEIFPNKSKHRKLRILTYRWHVPHQYELYKSGHDFFLVQGTGSPMCDQWEYGHRPLPPNAHFINIEDIRESEFDLAILHFDENVLTYENTNGKIGPEWGAAFRYFVEHVNLPKVAICHGTPQFHGQYTPGYDKPDLMQVIEYARAALVSYVKDIEIVCNSYQAQREWGFHKSRVIWHGFDPSEFLPATYNRGILSPLGPLVQSRPHYRGFYLYQQVFSEDFPKAFLPETLSVPDPDIDYVDNVFAVAKYKNYIDQIRQYSVYFNPTLRSPMPRARCEPMMCGVITVNANNHDVDLFIENGVNGFYSNEPAELRDQLLYLMGNPDAVKKMGIESRKTAISVFNHDRYLADWSNVFSTFK